MSSQSFYRKWRSQTFADVVGQDHVTRTLRNALEMGRIAHAYLFCGPRGVGKTSVARILAKGINCQALKDGEPCNECPMCNAITEGRALDVIEVDAASNRRIEEMRDLRDKVNFTPSEARYKVYILDEAHMLTNEASNALLKTLEEPPPHTVFVLITTEAHKIAETIVSRCQRFNFRRILTKESVARLSMVCEQEKLSVPQDALAVVARAATGSLRDAEGLLDQLVAYCGREISVAQVQEVLGLAGEAAVLELAEHLLGQDLGRGLELIERVAENGADMRRFAEDLVGYLRSMLLVKTHADTSALADIGPDTLDALKRAAPRVALNDLVAFIRIFADVGIATRGGVAPQLAVELALAEAVLHQQREKQAERQVAPTPARSERPVTLPRRESRPEPMRPGEPAAAGSVGASAPGVAARPPADAMPAAPREPAKPVTVVESKPAGDGTSSGTPAAARAATGDLGTLLEQLRRQWDSDVVDAVGVVNKPLQALLRSCGPYEVRGEAIVMGCDSQFHSGKLGERQHRNVLDQRLRELFGRHVPLLFEVVPRQKRGQLPPPTSDPLVKEVLSWGGRIRAVVPTGGGDPDDETGNDDMPPRGGGEAEQ